MPSVIRAAAHGRHSRREAMERRLLGAVEQLVGDGASFTELSVERLAAAAGISRSTFYVHFRDKRQLVLRLVRTVLAELHEISGRWWSVSHRAVRPDLLEAVAAIVAVYRRHTAVFTAAVETASYDATVAAELRSQTQAVIDATRSAIERGQAAGIMRAVNPAVTAAVLTGMVERAGHQLIRRSDPAGDHAIVLVLTDVIWTVLYGGEPTG